MTNPRMSTQQPKLWEWSLLLMSPFVFGGILKIFPIDTVKVILIAGIMFVIFLVLRAAASFFKYISPFLIGLIFILYLLSTPFWAMNFEKKNTNNQSLKKFAIYFN